MTSRWQQRVQFDRAEVCISILEPSTSKTNAVPLYQLACDEFKGKAQSVLITITGFSDGCLVVIQYFFPFFKRCVDFRIENCS